MGCSHRFEPEPVWSSHVVGSHEPIVSFVFVEKEYLCNIQDSVSWGVQCNLDLIAVQQHWRSLRDDATRKTNSKFEEHRRKVKRNNRLKRKLSRRLQSLQKSTLSENDKDKAKEILSSPNAIDFMSSEESEIDDPDSTSGPKPRKTRKLTWERTKLRNIKSKLDEAHLNGLSEKQRRTSARVTRTETASVRPCPTNAPSWAVRTD
ncbi:hypothetical protein ACROYT_G011336 [Oculina patagonica]